MFHPLVLLKLNSESFEMAREWRNEEMFCSNRIMNGRDSKPENTDPVKDLLKMIFMLIIIYVVCYFPYQAHYVWERVCNITVRQFRYHQLFMDYNFILICVPIALHPLCYGAMNSFFAKAFSKITLCLLNNDECVSFKFEKILRFILPCY